MLAPSVLFLLLNRFLAWKCISLRFEKDVFESWASGISDQCAFNLQQQIINRDEHSNLLSVNFDPQVSVTIGIIFYFYS